MEPITYEIVESIDLDELTSYYIRQGHRAPSSREKLERMVAGSFCVVAARRDDGVILAASAVLVDIGPSFENQWILGDPRSMACEDDPHELVRDLRFP